MLKKSILFLCLISLSCNFLQAMEFEPNHNDSDSDKFELMEYPEEENRTDESEQLFEIVVDGFVIIPDNLPNVTQSLSGANQKNDGQTISETFEDVKNQQEEKPQLEDSCKTYVQTKLWGDSIFGSLTQNTITTVVPYNKKPFSFDNDKSKKEPQKKDVHQTTISRSSKLFLTPQIESLNWNSVYLHPKNLNLFKIMIKNLNHKNEKNPVTTLALYREYHPLVFDSPTEVAEKETEYDYDGIAAAFNFLFPEGNYDDEEGDRPVQKIKNTKQTSPDSKRKRNPSHTFHLRGYSLHKKYRNKHPYCNNTTWDTSSALAYNP